MTLKIKIFQFYDLSEPKSDIFPWVILKCDTRSFLSKNIKVFHWLSKLKSLNFITKVNRKNGNESKSDIFPWDIFKSDTIFFSSEIFNVFLWFRKLESPSFMTKVNPNNGNETKSNIFPSHKFHLDTKSISISFLIKKH